MKYGYWFRILSDEAGTLPEFDEKPLEQLCDRIFFDEIPYPGARLIQRGEMLNILEPGDQLIVPTLEQFAQDLDDLVQVMCRLFDKKVAFSALGLPEIGQYTGGIFPAVLGAVADFQRSVRRALSKREARAVMMRGRNGGRPTKDRGDVARALRLYDQNKLSIQEITERTGVSKTTLYKYLAARRQDLAREKAAEKPDGQSGNPSNE